MPKALVAVVAGVLATVVWPLVEGYVLDFFAVVAFRSMSWRIAQALAGALSAVAVSLPVALFIRPTTPKVGLLYVGAIVITQILSMLYFNAHSHIGTWVSLPDTWAFLVVSLVLFIWVSRRHAAPSAA